MSRPDPDNMDPGDEGRLSLATRPPPYPIEEAMEEAMAPETIVIPQDREPDPWDDTMQPGSQQLGTRSGSEPQQAQVLGTHHLEPGSAPARAPAREPDTEETVPDTLAERLAPLPKWQARYVVTLYEVGGIDSLAAMRNNVSLRSVAKAQRENPDFSAACEEALKHRTDLVVAATFKGATVGDLRPKWHQGILVGYERRRDTKAAELMLKLDGKIDDGSGGKGNSASVTLVQVTSADTVATVVADAMARIYQARATSGRALPASGDK